MIKMIGRNRLKLFIVSACVTMLGSGLAFSKPKSDLVKEEPGYYYGYGKGSSTEEADFLAKKDLVENALTATVRLAKPAAQKITVSDNVVKTRAGDTKPYQTSKDGKTVTYRIKVPEWEKNEKAFGEKLRQSLSPSYESFVSK